MKNKLKDAFIEPVRFIINIILTIACAVVGILLLIETIWEGEDAVY